MSPGGTASPRAASSSSSHIGTRSRDHASRAADGTGRRSPRGAQAVEPEVDADKVEAVATGTQGRSDRVIRRQGIQADGTPSP